MVTALCNGLVLQGAEIVEGKAVLISEGLILDIVDGSGLSPGIVRVDLDGNILAPGFIDVQVNGGGGVLFNAAPTVETINVMAAAHRRYGTTGFFPTLISDDLSVVDRAMRAVEVAIAAGESGVLGIHLEGPFLSRRRPGIHNAEKIRTLDPTALDLLTSLKCGRTIVTVAPEAVGTEAIRYLSDAGVIVAAGHTEATYDEAVAAMEAGLTGFTHLFNAMPPLAGRAPGVVGAAIESQRAWCGIIVDGRHVHPAALRIALHARPLDRFLLVTDAMAPVGTSDLTFELDGRELHVVGDACIDNTGALAGTVLNMAKAVRNAVEMLRIDLAAALGLASASPADFVGLASKRGRIAPGHVADLVLLDEAIQVRKMWLAGALVDL